MGGPGGGARGGNFSPLVWKGRIIGYSGGGNHVSTPACFRFDSPRLRAREGCGAKTHEAQTRGNNKSDGNKSGVGGGAFFCGGKG